MTKVVRPIIYNTFSFERDSVAQYYDEDGILTQAAIDELRLGYDPETLEFIGPIFETAATNRVAKSNEFDHASWELTGLAPDLDVDTLETESPSGFNNATKFSGDMSLSSHSLRQSVDPGIGFSTAFVFSVYLKAEVADTAVRLAIGASSVVFRINVGDYSALGSNAFIKPLPDGWFRCEMWLAVDSEQYLAVQLMGTGTQAVYVYGAQFEIAGASYRASSYIHNSGTGTATRAEDIQAEPPAVISSNVPETDNPEYNPATSYNSGAEVMVTDGYHRNYRSLVAGTGTNTGNFPPDNPDKWLDLGATNRWRMFDMSVGADLQTSNADAIDVTVSLSGPIDSVVLFNVVGQTAIVTLYYGETVAYESEVDLTAPPLDSTWYDYYFDERTSSEDVAFLDLPPAYPATLRVQVLGSGTVELGKLVVGKSVALGFAEYGTTSIGITNYSTKETDDFGNTRVQPRRYVNRDNMKVVIEPGTEVRIRKFLAPLYTVPCAYITETGYEPVLTLGFYRDFENQFSTPASSYCTLQVEGI